MIIVEGCDGTGKSTLVKALSADLGLHVGVRSVVNRDKLYTVTREDTYRALGFAVEGYHAPFIWDRLFFSEPIYSRIMGRKCEFSFAESHFVRSVLKALRCPIIICNVPLETATENMEQKHQMEAVADNFPYIHSAYQGLINLMSDWATTYDYRVEGAYATLRDDVKRYTTLRREREWH